MSLKQKFTLAEIQRHDGDQELTMYIAYKGQVYDVTNCRKWQSGIHEGQHFPGQDLTRELADAPHAQEVFNYPCVKQIGILITK